MRYSTFRSLFALQTKPNTAKDTCTAVIHCGSHRLAMVSGTPETPKVNILGRAAVANLIDVL